MFYRLNCKIPCYEMFDFGFNSSKKNIQFRKFLRIILGQEKTALDSTFTYNSKKTKWLPGNFNW